MTVGSAGDSRRTVVVALTANLLIAAAKGTAAALTGSSALLAEAGHSVADSGNELFLLVALNRSGRPADETHPFGYGAERFYWSLLAAIGIFVAGGLTAIWDGVRQLQHPRTLAAAGVGYAVLAASLLLDGASWRTAYRQLRGESRGRGLSLRTYMRRSSDPTATTVFYEDTAGVIGVTLAAVGLALHQITGSGVPDALASFAIGVLLIVVAVRLARRDRELLTNRSASPTIVAGVRGLLLAEPGVTAVPRLEVLIVGPRTVLITGEVAIERSWPGGDVTRLVGELRQRLRTQPGVAEAYLTPVRDR
ncbi:MAG TPA: cation diffusion facilitator family transporter [Micromonosporaceae bacterium]|jgi:cation diffusion facilitator family transporter